MQTWGVPSYVLETSPVLQCSVLVGNRQRQSDMHSSSERPLLNVTSSPPQQSVQNEQLFPSQPSPRVVCPSLVCGACILCAALAAASEMKLQYSQDKHATMLCELLASQHTQHIRCPVVYLGAWALLPEPLLQLCALLSPQNPGNQLSSNWCHQHPGAE